MGTPATPVRIVVADDHQIVRSGFAGLLETQPDFTVVGTAEDGASAVRVCRETLPDVVLMDVRMPGMDGIEATRQLTAPGFGSRSGSGSGSVSGSGSGDDRPRIIILTTFDLDDYVYDALCAGASGFLLKDITAEQLFDAVRVIAAGEALLAPTVTRRLIGEFAKTRRTANGPATRSALSALGSLTPRETEVLRLVAAGLSNTEISEQLVVTEETVKTHVSRILAKLRLRDRTQAVVAAYESGLVVPGHDRGLRASGRGILPLVSSRPPADGPCRRCSAHSAPPSPPIVPGRARLTPVLRTLKNHATRRHNLRRKLSVADLVSADPSVGIHFPHEARREPARRERDEDELLWRQAPDRGNGRAQIRVARNEQSSVVYV
jgi:DNA-binding NarL/FixJ family response regulator